MLNQRQIKAADVLLNHMRENDGRSSKDEYPGLMNELGISNFDTELLVQLLVDHLQLIAYYGESKYIIILTPKGNQVSNKGVANYFKELEKEKELETKAKETSIDGIKKANQNAVIAIVIAIVMPLLIAVVQIYSGNGNETIDQRNNDSSIRAHVDNPQLPLQLTDTLFIKELKNSLKHDTVFLNDLMKQMSHKENH